MNKGKPLSREELLDMPVSPEMLEAARYPSKERLEESRQWWSKKYGRELTTEDAAEIHRNLFGYLKLLVEFDIERQRREAGGHVPDEKKVHELTYEIRQLEKQLETTEKMVKRWPKGEEQRVALEAAAAALTKKMEATRRKLEEVVSGPTGEGLKEL